jgi:hypothetical protein
MNKYLSSAEKERLIRLFLLQELLRISIDEYAEFEANKQFLGDLRRSKTFLKKSLDLRLLFLDVDAEINLIKSINKIGFAFLPKNEAKRELEKLKGLSDVYPIRKEAMQDWVEFMIENACKTCKREDFKECKGRAALEECDIPPWMPDAKDCCQYSYRGVKNNGL